MATCLSWCVKGKKGFLFYWPNKQHSHIDRHRKS